MKQHIWWCLATFLIVLISYEKMLKSFEKDYSVLLEKKELLLQEKNRLLMEKHRLEEEILSQNDPEWVELTLMKVLGVVPEGAKKVFFENRKANSDDP